MNIRRLLGTALALLFLGMSGIAQELPDNIQKTSSLGGITEYRLDNGMRVLLFPDSSSPKTTVNITYLVGSRHEGYGETGMAHLLEHLLFKGSTDHTDIPQELSEHGASANGTTWYDRTNYYETFPASRENLEWALSLEADRMINSFVAKKDLDSEMTVVRNEFERGENNPSGILTERVFSTAYLWHNYGKSTIGARSDIENVPIDRLQAFYKKYYQPDNAILIVAGKFDPEETLSLISEKFGPIPEPNRTLPTTYTAEPVQDGEREVELRRTGDVQVVAVAYHIPAGSAPEFAAVDVLGEILADTPSGRLYKNLVQTKLATEISGGAYQLHDPSLLFLEAETRKDGDLDKLQAELLKTAHSFTENPPTDEEVERAKKALLKNMDNVQRDTQRLALQLSEWASMGDWRLFFLYKDRLNKVTTSEVAAAAQKYIKDSNQTIGRFVPEESPERAEVAEVDLTQLETDLSAFKMDEAVVEGEDFDPTPENIKSRTTYAELGDNINLAMLPKKTRGSTVNLTLTLEFGNLEAVFNRGTEAAFTGAMLMRGTESLTREQIKDALTGLSANGSVSGDYDSITAQFETTRENLPEVLRLAADIMKNPAFPVDEFETLREIYISDLEEARSEPSSRAGLKMGLLLDPYEEGDPRAATTIEEDIAAARSVTLEELQAFHEEFYGANRGQIALVGDFDPTEVEPLLRELLGDWENADAPAYERIPSKVKPVEKGTKEIVSIPDKANAVFYAAMKVPMKDTHPDYAALRLANYIIGGGFLNSRLATRVRQKEGLSYSIGSSFSANSLDPSATFSIYAIAAPDNINKVNTAIREELDRVLENGFTEQEVEAAKRGYLESLKVARSKDSNLAYLLKDYLNIERDIMWLAEWDEKVAALTPEQLQQAVKEHLDPEKLTVVLAGTLPAE